MKIIFGNLKMNFLYKDFQAYIDDLRLKMKEKPPKTIAGLAIPYIYLKEAADKIGASVKVMAQDLHPADFGAFTSFVSAPQIASLEVPATMVGHSECRKTSQNPLVITNKVVSALSCGLEVIYCCGKDPIAEISEELKTLSAEDWKRVIVAYEPLSAIGSGSAMDPTQAEQQLFEIRDLIKHKWGFEVSSSVRLLYGGSVNLSNYKDYLNKENINGVLVGGASLKVDDFWKMVTLE